MYYVALHLRYDASPCYVATRCATLHGYRRRIYAGFDGAVRVFDLSRPGRDSTLIKTFDAKNKEGQKGADSPWLAYL